jgi:hypothetical protein
VPDQRTAPEVDTDADAGITAPELSTGFGVAQAAEARSAAGAQRDLRFMVHRLKVGSPKAIVANTGIIGAVSCQAWERTVFFSTGFFAAARCFRLDDCREHCLSYKTSFG